MRLDDLPARCAGVALLVTECEFALNQDLIDSQSVSNIAITVPWNILNKVLLTSINIIWLKDRDVGNIADFDFTAFFDPPDIRCV